MDELLFEGVKKQAYAKQLLSRDHFTVDGTLIEACASLMSQMSWVIEIGHCGPRSAMAVSTR